MTPATAQGQTELGKRMWMAFMRDAEKFDNGEAKDWKGDSDSILVFVRPALRPAVHHNDGLEVWPSLRNRWRIYHRILQEIVTR
jgi:hypothetical protein